MTNVKFKSNLNLAVTATLYSEELNLSFPSGKNAYRVDAIKIQINDFDAEAANDAFCIQLAYTDLAAGAFLTIDNEDEILTLGEVQATMTAQNEQMGTVWHDRLRQSGILYLSGRDFKDVFIVKTKCHMNAENIGQDAAEVMHYWISGQYVKLDAKVIDNLRQGVTLT